MFENVAGIGSNINLSDNQIDTIEVDAFDSKSKKINIQLLNIQSKINKIIEF